MKTVVVTPAGRRRYLEILSRYVLSDTDVDRWDIWLNTDNVDDIDYITSLATNPKVRVVTVPDKICHPVAFRIHKFFSQATDADTIYVRLDDDIVYYAPNSISNLVLRRANYKDAFLVYGNVVNSAITSHVHQRNLTIPLEWGKVKYTVMDEVGWKNPQFAEKLHRLFLSYTYPYRWYNRDWLLYDYERHSINVISWYGDDCANWCRNMNPDEEVWLSQTYPSQIKRPNIIAGDNLFVHYAFYTQREYLDKTDILSQYDKLSKTVSI